jgi:DNA-binding transcriptional MerR regulator
MVQFAQMHETPLAQFLGRKTDGRDLSIAQYAAEEDEPERVALDAVNSLPVVNAKQSSGHAVKSDLLRDLAAAPRDLALGAGRILVGMIEMSPSEFGAATGLTPKALRVYEERGLLIPRVDRANGYRRYDADQVLTGARIALLRRAGVGLSEIGRFLDDPSAGVVDRWLALRRMVSEPASACRHENSRRWPMPRDGVEDRREVPARR